MTQLRKEQVAGKQDTLVSGTNIKTVYGSSILGSGDLLLYPSVFTLTWSPGATMNHALYSVFAVTVNATGTLAHSNVPAAGNEAWFRLRLTWTSGALTFPTSWTKGDGANINQLTTGNYTITGMSVDGGTSWEITVLRH